MIGNRNPMKDRVAIAAATTTGFEARNTERSQASYVAQACTQALRQCGLTARDVDGICGSTPAAPAVQKMLGIDEVTWFATPMIPFVNHLAAAASAVHSGLCDVVLAYHGAYRLPWNTGSAIKDPFRRGISISGDGGIPPPESIAASSGYTAWASRYMYEFGATKEQFGLVAINDRTNAALNPAAAMREPITMHDYLSARMIRWPLCMLDMDIAVDGADAFVITTPERARDMPLPPVLVQAVALGMIDKNEEDQMPGLRRHGQHVTVDALKAKSDFWIDDVDVYFPYDGFTVITLNWFENAGFCGPGEAGDFIEQHWDEKTNRILIDGRIPVNPHGGALSEGATQGSGHVREAVHQLQGLAGERQVEGAERAIVTAGGFFFNAQGVTLRRD
jgi:acetyl-CoA acetyltransferase